MPQMLLLRDYPFDFDVYIVPDRTPWFREALQLIGLPNRPIFTIREVAGDVFDSIALLNEFDAEGFFSEEIAGRIAALSRTVWPSTIVPSRSKIYLSRRLSGIERPSYRPLTNEKAVEDVFERRGFRILYPETLSLSEQIGLCRQASAIAGPSGSGMLNAIFAEAGTRVLDLESFHYTVRQHAKIYSSTGKRYAFLFGDVDGSGGRPLHLAPWSVNMDVLDEAISWIEGSDAGSAPPA